MASSNVFSRILQPATGRSIYEAIREQEEEAIQTDSEDEDLRAALKDENLEERFRDEDLDRLLAEDAATRPDLQPHQPASPESRPHDSAARPRWMSPGRDPHIEDDDVSPEQLLLEDTEAQSSSPRSRPLRQELPQPVPGPSERRQQKIRWGVGEQDDGPANHTDKRQTASLFMADPADKAMMRWANVEDLDKFLQQVYGYYLGNGIWSILLADVLQLMTLAFVVTLTVFLSSCVRFSAIPGSNHLDDVLIPKCTQKMSWLANLVLWIVAVGFVVSAVNTATKVRELKHMHDFYEHLLGIPDGEMQTISWQEVVSRIMNLREQNPRTARGLHNHAMKYMRIRERSKVRMDAHDIANRIMRQENYLIALFNKDVLDLTIPLPYLRHKHLFTRSLQAMVVQSILDFVFNENGQVKQAFLKDADRQQLADALKRRFIINGFIYILIGPVYVSYYLIVYFLRYFKEFQKDPGQISSRRYTPYAAWKFREFNELDHFFEDRLKKSYPAASHYIDQFPKDKTNQLARFVSFVFGSLAAVLAIISLLDPDVFLGFELTPERTVLFYITVFTAIWHVSHGMVADETMVYDPEYTMQEVIAYTHYEPAGWKGRLHSDDVRTEFSQLYKMKVLIFLEELLGIIVTPYVLWFSLPNSAERIIDFFREFTIHVDGLGYVCWFAHFNFKTPGMAGARHDGPGAQSGPDVRQDYYEAKDGKMMTSYYNFLDSYSGDPRRRSDRRATTAQDRHPATRRSFHPPPAFPGLHAGGRASGVHEQPGPSRPAWSAYRSPPTHAAAASSHIEPPASLLLDPQHQPSPTIRPLRRPNALGQSRYRPQRGPGAAPHLSMTPVRRDEETESALIEQDSNLGDSWKGGDPDEGSGEEEDGAERLEDPEGKGVLGLLYQFQRAQGGRAGGGGVLDTM